VSSLWKSLKRTSPDAYRLTRLVDRRVRETPPPAATRHVICDIDKTYLETEFESLIRMVRIAFEAATAKVTVTGASEVLLAARWGDLSEAAPSLAGGESFPRPLHFVSSSPPQLRSVLEEKLMMDGLDWTSDTFKDQAYNIRMRRMDLLRQHVAYKSLAILRLVATAGPGARFYLIGDNAETDAYIYTGVKLLLDGHLGADGYRRYLETAGVEARVAADLVAELPERRGQSVAAILIRNVPGYQFVAAPPLTDAVQIFDNFYQAALLLLVHEVIEPGSLWELTRRFHNHHGMSQRQLSGMLAVLRDADVGNDALRGAVANTMARLVPPQASDVPAGWRAQLTSQAGLAALAESATLSAAAAWMTQLRHDK
jgi:hypothetical protein